MFRRKDRTPDVKLCANCRYWSGSDGTLLAGSSAFLAQCRRFPPARIPSTEPARRAHEDAGKHDRPYIRQQAWEPVTEWPETRNTDWCAEWAATTPNDWQRHRALSEISRSSENL
jgi:hypothetical protein